MLKRIDSRIGELERIKQEIQTLLAETGNGEAVSGKAHEQRDGRFVLQAAELKKLRVAAIMDTFTLGCFRPECELTELTPDSWQAEMEAARPELLFIESAWEGKGGLWHGKVNHCAPELYELTEYCHEKNIPVVFWNKEDPGFTDTFMATAQCADMVFTTDLECVEKYKTELGHDNVYHLHFAAQPLVHNPVEKYERRDRYCFAGAYYHRYTERCQVFDAFAEHFIQTKGLDIYDRNYPAPRPEHKFPEMYDPYILGRLDPADIDVAYKGYVYGINMNSSPQSQTMFARRVFELMASNTVVVGNYCRGVKNYFGDLTLCTDDVKTLKTALERYCGTRSSADKYRLLGLRKVLQEHLCEDRLDYIVQKVFGRSLKKPMPAVTVLSHAEDQAQADRVLAMFRRQSYEDKRLIVVGEGVSLPADGGTVVAPAALAGKKPGELTDGFIAWFAPEDWYGENYLLDMALALRYGEFDVIGKGEYLRGAAERMEPGRAYRPAEKLVLRRAMARPAALDGMTADALTAETVLESGKLFAVDWLNYCEAWSGERCPAAEDMTVADQGIGLDVMEAAAARIAPVMPALDSRVLTAAEIAAAMPKSKLPVTVQPQGTAALMESGLPAGQHQYIYLNGDIPLDALAEDGTLQVLFRGRGDLDLVCCCVFYDSRKNKLDAKYPHLGRREKLAVPEGARFVRLAFRPRGPGRTTLESIELGAATRLSAKGGCFLTRSSVLVLTNHYPAPGDLYRNMFVHKRVAIYKEQGCPVDVLRMNPYAKEQFREFEGVNVAEGHGDMLLTALTGGTIDTVCVHFLDRDMWDVLKNFLDNVRLLIWSHGADIQPWWRREFNYSTEEQRLRAQRDSEARMALWNEVFDAAEKRPDRVKFVFVSQYFADEVMEDYGRTFSAGQYEVIHNLVDTELFAYREKDAEKRKHILTIKPFSSRKYGNDLTTKAIVALSKRECFSELEFTICGDGASFEKDTAPLKKFKNVHLRKTFMTQREIAALHGENGVFIATTRWDSQGVSRDEAMSSGLVPVTNAVAAIPEFVDDTCGILAPAEDYEAIADGIERLYEDPELFLEMSKNAAARVRRQTSREYTVDRELALIFPEGHFCQVENGFLTVSLPGAAPGSEPAQISVLRGGTLKEKYTLRCGHFTVPLVYPGQYEVSVHSGGFSASRAFCTDTVREPAKISIFGSCVSRDLFRLFPTDAFEVRTYIARQTVQSAVSEPVPLALDDIHVDIEFEKKAIWKDFNKTAFQQFRSDGSQWLIIDLIEERFPRALIHGRYVTKSLEAVNGAVIPEDAGNIYPDYINGDYCLDGHCIRKEIKAFCDKLTQIYQQENIIIHQAFCVEDYWNGSGELVPYPEIDLGAGRAVNHLIRYMYSAIREYIPGAHVIDCMDGWHGSAAHTWGVATVHYEDGYYAEVIRRLGEIIFGRGEKRNQR